MFKKIWIVANIVIKSVLRHLEGGGRPGACGDTNRFACGTIRSPTPTLPPWTRGGSAICRFHPARGLDRRRF